MTRYTLTFIVCVCASFVLRAQPQVTVANPNGPVMKFDSTAYWFDTVYQGSIVDHEYHFTNTGKEPLIIFNVCGSSGSVCPSFPKEPIAPGKSSFIRIVFSTTGKMGPQDKTVTITSNASEPTIVLHIRGIVTAAPKLLYTSGTIPNNSAFISFDTTAYDFGMITEGDSIEHRFNFTNTGTAPIVLSSAFIMGAGFTTEYSHNKIAPGDSGYVIVRFNSADNMGALTRICTVHSNNINGDVALVIKVFVKPKLRPLDNH